MANEIEHVVLVNENNEIIGTMAKSSVHTVDTPLHRAFSVFIFNDKKQLLLQQRSHLKKTWPLAWSNSCCGHPSLNEENIDAAKRRIMEELGMTMKFIQEVEPYRYRFSKDGIMENEICPILVGLANDEIMINHEEVEGIVWVTWSDFLKEISKDFDKYSPWCREEAIILEKSDNFKKLKLI